MSSKVAQLREAMSIAQDFTKAHILFVPVPALNDADHERLRAMLALRVMQIAQETSPLAPEGGKPCKTQPDL